MSMGFSALRPAGIVFRVTDVAGIGASEIGGVIAGFATHGGGNISTTVTTELCGLLSFPGILFCPNVGSTVSPVIVSVFSTRKRPSANRSDRR